MAIVMPMQALVLGTPEYPDGQELQVSDAPKIHQYVKLRELECVSYGLGVSNEIR